MCGWSPWISASAVQASFLFDSLGSRRAAVCRRYGRRVIEHVVPWEEDLRWEPNAAEAVLLTDEFGTVVLAMRAHLDDPDDRCVVLRWEGVRWNAWGAPNDEARWGHPLWSKGLGEILWSGVVQDSALLSELEHRNRVHPRHDPSRYRSLTHWVVLTKERTAEVAGASLTVQRLPGATLEAASSALKH